MYVLAQGFHDPASQQWQSVADTIFVAAASWTELSGASGSQAGLPPRLLRHLAQVAVPAPSQATIHAILSSILVGGFQGFAEAVTASLHPLVKASVAALEQLGRLLPASGPDTAHYKFNLHDALRHAQVPHPRCMTGWHCTCTRVPNCKETAGLAHSRKQIRLA